MPPHGTFFVQALGSRFEAPLPSLASRLSSLVSRLSSTPNHFLMPDFNAYITVCQLMRTHGVKGHIKAMPLTHDITRHKSLKAVAVKKTNGEILDLEIEESRQAGNLWLLKF